MKSWTDAEVAKAVTILERSRSVDEALKRLKVTGPALRAGLQRARERGFSCGAPADHIGRPRPVSAAPSGRTVMVWPDTHAPYHDPEAVAVALAVLRTVKPDTLVILGDFLDCYSVSRFPKDPKRKHLLREEIDQSIYILDEIQKACRNVKFIKGNHEVRLEALIGAQAPALDGMISIEKELGIKERGWSLTEYKQSLKLGHMLYSHDFGRHGVHAGYQGLMDLGSNICFGHTHKLGTVYRGAHVSLNCGWLGDVNAVDYRHADIARREYQLGFGLVDEDESGCVWPQAVAIVNGAAMVRGRRITA